MKVMKCLLLIAFLVGSLSLVVYADCGPKWCTINVCEKHVRCDNANDRLLWCHPEQVWCSMVGKACSALPIKNLKCCP
jgi:hypothetical protein